MVETSGRECAICGKAIAAERLEAVPDATLCVECQGADEKGAPIPESYSGESCPRCAKLGMDAALVWRRARDPSIPGEFLGCSRYPACQYVERRPAQESQRASHFPESSPGGATPVSTGVTAQRLAVTPADPTSETTVPAPVVPLPEPAVPTSVSQQTLPMGPAEPREEVFAYTDGACRGNPGPGGYGAVLVCGKARKELSGGCRRTTNNRMEILACIHALRALKRRCSVTLFTDSQYVAGGLGEGWARRWREKDWWISANKRAKNTDLWAELLDLAEKHEVRIEWVRGHDSVQENCRADQLAVAAAAVPDLPPDEGFERHESEPLETTIREGHPCFKCQTPVQKRSPKKRSKPGQSYYYEWILYCPGCRTMYMMEEAKRMIDQGAELGLRP